MPIFGRVRRVAPLATVAIFLAMAEPVPQPGGDGFTRQFVVDPSEWRSTGRNPYFVLEPGYQLALEDGQERLVITVLAQTRSVAGVETRIVEERETKAGALVEVSRNFFAISARSNSVFYFGEEVDMYKGGKVVSHEGSWLADTKSMHFGLVMPGLPLLGARYYQEVAPAVAMDRAEVVSVSDQVVAPAGRFSNVLRVEETTPLEPGTKEYKSYAAGIGLLQDGSLKLVRYGPGANK